MPSQLRMTDVYTGHKRHRPRLSYIRLLVLELPIAFLLRVTISTATPGLARFHAFMMTKRLCKYLQELQAQLPRCHKRTLQRSCLISASDKVAIQGNHPDSVASQLRNSGRGRQTRVSCELLAVITKGNRKPAWRCHRDSKESAQHGREVTGLGQPQA